MEFWARVKSEIKRQKTTQGWVADRIPVKQDLFRRWASRGIMPNADQAVAIAKALGVTVEYLVTGQDHALPSEHLRKLFADEAKLPPEDIAEIQALVSFKLNRKTP